VSAGIKIDTTPPDLSEAYIHDVAGSDKSVDRDTVPRPEVLCAQVVGPKDCDSILSGDCTDGIVKYVWTFGYLHDSPWQSLPLTLAETARVTRPSTSTL